MRFRRPHDALDHGGVTDAQGVLDHVGAVVFEVVIGPLVQIYQEIVTTGVVLIHVVADRRPRGAWA